MEIASVRVHRIVATAFHGNPPTKEYVVDHIDTNRQNNRPDTLTRLKSSYKCNCTYKTTLNIVRIFLFAKEIYGVANNNSTTT